MRNLLVALLGLADTPTPERQTPEFHSEAHDSGGAGSRTINVPASVAKDDALIAALRRDASGTVTPPAGWIQIADFFGSPTFWTCFQKRATASEPGNYVFNITGAARSEGVIVAYGNVSVAAPIYAVSAETDATATNNITAADAAVRAKGMALHVGVANDATDTFTGITPPGGYTERVDFGNASDAKIRIGISEKSFAANGATGSAVAVAVPSAGVADNTSGFHIVLDGAKATVLLLHCNGEDGTTLFPDSSEFSHTVTANGNAQIDTAKSKFGGASALFDGTGDYLSVPDHPAFSFSSALTSDFTIELVVEVNDLGTLKTLIGKRANAAAFGPFLLQRSAANNITVSLSSNGTTYDIASAVSLGAVTTGQKYHVALSRQGTVFRGYLEGAQTSVATSAAALIVNSAAVTIGGDTDANSLNGWIDELRITKGVARYTAAFTPPTKPFEE